MIPKRTQEASGDPLGTNPLAKFQCSQNYWIPDSAILAFLTKCFGSQYGTRVGHWRRGEDPDYNEGD